MSGNKKFFLQWRRPNSSLRFISSTVTPWIAGLCPQHTAPPPPWLPLPQHALPGWAFILCQHTQLCSTHSKLHQSEAGVSSALLPVVPEGTALAPSVHHITERLPVLSISPLNKGPQSRWPAALGPASRILDKDCLSDSMPGGAVHARCGQCLQALL